MRRKNEFAKASRERLFMWGFFVRIDGTKRSWRLSNEKTSTFFLKLTFFASNKTEFHRNIWKTEMPIDFYKDEFIIKTESVEEKRFLLFEELF